MDRTEDLERQGGEVVRLRVVMALKLVALVLVGLLIWVAVVSGTGFGGKTLWDWMDLLIIPAVLGPGVVGGVIWFNAQRSQAEKRVASERSHQESLQAYLDRITQLLLENELRESIPKSVVRHVARAHTLTALRGLDGERKGKLLRFLHESELIKRETKRKGVINLRGADLSGANLSGADLHRADLGWADLSGAGLWRAYLSGAFLSRADLRGAHLFEAKLRRADLSGADLRGANLFEANLFNANLFKAELDGADLSGAELSGAIVTTEQLESAKSLKGATMPDGAKHD